MGLIFFIVTLVVLFFFFFLLYHQKYLSHILFLSQLVSVCFTMKLFYSFKIHCLQMLQLFQIRNGPFCFIVTLVYTCRTFFLFSFFFFFFFLLYHQKYLSHILFLSQLVSVCFTMKLFYSFKIHCLQMLQLFQTRDGPFVLSSHLFTLVALFCCIIRK